MYAPNAYAAMSAAKGGGLMQMSGNMPIFHNALAGAFGAAMAAYWEPEILRVRAVQHRTWACVLSRGRRWR